MNIYEDKPQLISTRIVMISFAVVMIIQPLFDIMSYFTNQIGITSISTLVRFGLLGLVTLFGFIISKRKGRYFICAGVLAAFFALHFMANYLAGYLSIGSDIAMYARVIQLPLFFLAFLDVFDVMKREYSTEEINHYVNKLVVGILLTITASIALSYAIGMPEYTYNNGLAGPHGIKGWFLNGNSQSVILCVVVSITLMTAVQSKNWFITIGLFAIGYGSLFFFGTKLSFYAMYLISAALIVIILLSKEKQWLKILLVIVAIVSVYAFRTQSPMYVNTYYTDQSFAEWQHQIEDIEKEDPTKPTNPISVKTDKAYFEQNRELYIKTYSLNSKSLVDVFGIDRVAEKYDYTLDATILINNRNIKLVAASLVYDDASTLQHVFGFEQQRYYVGGENFDLENDLHGIFYSYGYVGFAMYLGFILYVLLRGIYSYFFSKEFRFNQNLAIYLVALGLIMGASQFSGHVLKRPNVVFYISLVMALVTINSETILKRFRSKK